MKKTINRLMALLLTLALSFSLISTAALAAGYSTVVYDTGRSDYMITVKDNVPIRSTAGKSASVYATLAKGSLIRVSGSTKNSAGNLWYKADMNGTVCYIFSGNLKAAPSTFQAQLLRATKKAPLRPAPYENASAVKSVAAGTLLRCVGSLTNKHGNTWKIVKNETSASLLYVYAGNIAASYSTGSNLFLNVKANRQTTDWSCSGAVFQNIVQYYNPTLNISDVDYARSTGGYVYKLRDTLNAWLGGIYCYNTFSTPAAYETAVRTSLAQGSPVIARIAITDCQYFNYSSTGHYTLIKGIYKDSSGTTWLEVADSYCQNFSSNSFTNRETGTVRIPLNVMFRYGSYNSTSPVYLIYNP